MSLRFIKDRFRNLLVILVFLSGIPYLRFLVHRYKQIPLVRIICWHKVPARKQFLEKIRFLIKRFNVVGITDFIKHKNLVSDRINLVLSFDDGRKNWLHNVLPVLEEYQLPALFFISSGCLNRSDELSAEEVKAIASHKGFIVASHGRFHKDLAKLDHRELESEVLEDKKYLETLTGQTIEYFAFPFGHRVNFNEKIFDYYRWVFSIVPGFNKRAVPGRMIHRDSIDIFFSRLLFLAWLYGSYDWYWQHLCEGQP